MALRYEHRSSSDRVILCDDAAWTIDHIVETVEVALEVLAVEAPSKSSRGMAVW